MNDFFFEEEHRAVLREMSYQTKQYTAYLKQEGLYNGKGLTPEQCTECSKSIVTFDKETKKWSIRPIN